MKLKPSLIKAIAICACLYGLASLFDFDDHLFNQFTKYTNQYQGFNQSIQLDEYDIEIDALPIQGIEKNLSGITYSSTTNLLYGISNSPRYIYELNKEGKLLRKIKLHKFRDTEGITFLKDNLFAIVDEEQGSIFVIEINDDTTDIYKQHNAKQFSLNIDAFENFGYEGIAYHAEKDGFYIVNERFPMEVIKISNWLNGQGPLSIGPEKQMNRMNNFMDDFSGLHFNSNNQTLLFLSDESMLVTEVALDGSKLSYLDLEKGFFGLKQDIPQAEGITLDQDGLLYIVSEPNLFYRYQKD
ncbi:SdiA-regulated domain-containing protein [Shewanella gelidii]|uniref:SdiA-regulated family protein n=1 Tax=Shewanella gelidii TaxID=1642821 RepID=A0A917N966_9GAMM|nr:SdiA-regulated domain-containing protein [Shewanella gelidii]MCL1097656.1 SdiA-regulated domain-containing protein [Shewanella gelidii]GGI79844.1 hypothetical protein GCM10009332_16510 [Shewanella gelidii]